MGGSGPVGFDLDMTLINSRPAILTSFAEVSRETGTAIDLDAVDRRLGVKLEDELAFWFPPDQVAAAAGLYRQHYLRLAGRMTTVLPGAHEALAAVRAVAYVGDTPPDMAAAVQASARAVGVATGSFTGEDLADAGAEVVLDSLTGFPAWYRSA
jgi:phosphoglycolate phosphatase